MEELRRNIIVLLKKAINGELSIEDFYESFPYEIKSNEPSIEIIYDDIESAIEHFPASILDGSLKKDVFQNSDEYRNLVIDLELLNSDVGKEDFIEKRRLLIGK